MVNDCLDPTIQSLTARDAEILFGAVFLTCQTPVLGWSQVRAHASRALTKRQA